MLARLQAIEPGVTDLQSHFLYFIDTSRALDARERARLDQLLDDGGQRPTPMPQALPLLVVPRPGTISPWSSKATDIAHVCALQVVRRIERGTLYLLQLAQPPSAKRRAALG
ncbi:MAG: hypothetical protein ACRESY_04800, partial [Steroidobacteraceae bacterium]